ncbi:TIGR03503 family protein [Alteromonadaceae bacterium M269]|nr:TIGR03503 family protein [Alteromonadaceae bacterium M269]
MMKADEKEMMDKPEVVDQTPLTRLGTEYENSIRLLQNRFRIDHEVSEITMVFFRRFGSAPVVLVRPNGSKIFQGDADDDKVTWFDSATFDMIKIKNPVPGPWQAVGQILPESRVMVVSEIKLHVEPLPTLLFSGEILKQTATLSNGGEVIDTRQFSDVVQLRMQFVSTNNPDFNNFGSQTQDIATFTDNGLGMDERPLDGVYTGQYNLRIPEGEWRALFTVDTPMFSREQMGDPLRLFPNPVTLTVEKAEEGEGYHRLMIDADRENVDITSLLIDGKVTYPNGDVQNFSLSEQTDQARVHQVINYEYGIFRAKVTVFGKTQDGRDFILDVPEFTFLVEEPELESALDGQVEGTETANDEPELVTDEVITEELPPEEENNTKYYIIIASVNLGILIIGGILIWWFMRDKSNKPEKQPKDGSPSFFSKLFKKKKDKEEGKDSGKKEESEIADLSMSDS